MTIKELRSKAGMSQSQFANHFGVSVRTVQGWEQGSRKPFDYQVAMMARILELENMQSIIFKDDRHEKDYRRFLKKMKRSEPWLKMAAYLLALDAEIAEHTEDVFDFSAESVKMDTALDQKWQNVKSQNTTRLLMNLWNGHCSDYSGEGENQVSLSYTVNEVFCCPNAPYYWEAIKLRYPEFDKQSKEK